MSLRHREKRRTALRYLLALPRSIVYNFRLFPLRQAWRLPLLLSHHTVVRDLSGHIEIQSPQLKTGLIIIGFNGCPNSDFRYHRPCICIQGNMVVKGNCAIGMGAAIEVAEDAVLTLGPMFCLGPRSTLICHKAMTFGNHSRISWDCTLMDTDQHALTDATGTRTNPDREVVFGDNVWLGHHVIVTKGTHLASHITAAAGARLVGSYDQPLSILAGNPATIVKQGVKRSD